MLTSRHPTAPREAALLAEPPTPADILSAVAATLAASSAVGALCTWLAVRAARRCRARAAADAEHRARRRAGEARASVLRAVHQTAARLRAARPRLVQLGTRRGRR